MMQIRFVTSLRTEALGVHIITARAGGDFPTINISALASHRQHPRLLLQWSLLAFANGKVVLLLQQYLRRIIISFMATTISTMVLAKQPTGPNMDQMS
jgi:hypothetical protein